MIETFHGTINYLGGIGFPDLKGHETWDNTLIITPGSVRMIFADAAFSPRSFAVAPTPHSHADFPIWRVEHGIAGSLGLTMLGGRSCDRVSSDCAASAGLR